MASRVLATLALICSLTYSDAVPVARHLLQEEDDHDGHDHEEEEEEDDHDGHDHSESGPATWEWSDIFMLEDEVHTFMFQKTSGSGGGEEMEMAMGDDHDGHDHGRRLLQDDDHDGHDHETHAWEWSGVFDFEANEKYTLMFEKATASGADHEGHDHGRRLLQDDEHDGHDHGEEEEMEASGPTYADATMMISFHLLPAGGMEDLEEEAETLWEGAATQAEFDEGDVAPFVPGVLYNIHFDTTKMATFISFAEQTTGGEYAIFMQHFPTEFVKRPGHYLFDGHGKNVEPLSQSAVSPWSMHAYADATMLVSFHYAPLGEIDESIDAEAKLLWDAGVATEAEFDMGSVDAFLPGVLYNIHFDNSRPATFATIRPDQEGYYVFYMQHFPTEFEETAHYLVDAHGHNVEPYVKEAVVADAWAVALGTSFVVNLATLTGVILLVPGMNKLRNKHAAVFESITLSFAGGAILSTAFFLILFEATHLIAAGNWEPGGEVAVAWRWGTMILFGFMTPPITTLLLSTIMPKKFSDKPRTPSSTKVEPKEEGADEATKLAPVAISVAMDTVVLQEKENRRIRVLLGVLVGDFMHNFVDGIMIAVAFKYCSEGPLAWAVVGATVGHEIAQEIGDFCVLTTSGQLSPLKALIFNFVSGLSVMFGAIILLSVDHMPLETLGMILSYGGGTYIYIGGPECMGRVNVLAGEVSIKIQLASLLCFVVGAVAIGLVLLNHEHCFAPSIDGSDPHAGHNH